MSGQREMDAGAAEAALRHNVRPLTAGLPGSLGRALAALGADPAPAGSDGPGVVEAVAVEGLDPELVRALSEEVAAEGGRVVVGTGLTAAVLIGPPGGWRRPPRVSTVRAVPPGISAAPSPPRSRAAGAGRRGGAVTAPSGRRPPP